MNFYFFTQTLQANIFFSISLPFTRQLIHLSPNFLRLRLQGRSEIWEICYCLKKNPKNFIWICPQPFNLPSRQTNKLTTLQKSGEQWWKGGVESKGEDLIHHCATSYVGFKCVTDFKKCYLLWAGCFFVKILYFTKILSSHIRAWRVWRHLSHS